MIIKLEELIESCEKLKGRCSMSIAYKSKVRICPYITPGRKIPRDCKYLGSIVERFWMNKIEKLYGCDAHNNRVEYL